MAKLNLYREMILKDMETYILSKIGDDDITDYWRTYGLPDGWKVADLKEIADDDELWLDCVNAFAHCCRVAGHIE